MDVNQALALVEQVTSTYKGTRNDHVRIQTAIEVIKTALRPKDEPVASSKPKKQPEGK